jgi:hypothetical protein
MEPFFGTGNPNLKELGRKKLRVKKFSTKSWFLGEKNAQNQTFY